MFGDALADLPGQVQPAELRVRVLQEVDDPDGVAVVLEAAAVQTLGTHASHGLSVRRVIITIGRNYN